MTDLAAIVRATRRSAKAVDRMARYGRLYRETHTDEALRAYQRAMRDYAAAQHILAANPLPGDSK